MPCEAKEAEDQAQADHFQAWDKFWGRPGYGAPRQAGVAHKENLMKMLHYPAQVTFTSLGEHYQHLLFQAPNNLELSTLERLPVK